MNYHTEGDEFLKHIFIGGETWISYVNPETKQQSKPWKLSSLKPKKFKQLFVGKKLMATFSGITKISYLWNSWWNIIK